MACGLWLCACVPVEMALKIVLCSSNYCPFIPKKTTLTDVPYGFYYYIWSQKKNEPPTTPPPPAGQKKNLFQQPLDLHFVKPLLDYVFHVNPI